MTDTTSTITPMLESEGLVKTYGRVVALDGVDFALYPGEVLAVIGDNGAGKSTLIKCLSGAEIPNEGVMRLHGNEIQFRKPIEARVAGIETVYQTLAVAPALDIATNLFLGREMRKPGPLGSVFRMLEGSGMRKLAKEQMMALGIGTLQNMGQAVETLSGGQRQAVAVARAAAFGSKVIILDEPTAALGVRESAQVLKLIENLRERGLPVILISHNMPQVFEVADRIHVQRLGRRAAVITPQTVSITDVVAIMTRGAEGRPEGSEPRTRSLVDGELREAHDDIGATRDSPRRSPHWPRRNASPIRAPHPATCRTRRAWRSGAAHERRRRCRRTTPRRAMGEPCSRARCPAGGSSLR